jgi:hypothetical protein
MWMKALGVALLLAPVGNRRQASLSTYGRTRSALHILFMSKVALGLLDILLQFAPDAWCAGISLVGCLLEPFKFSLRPAKAWASAV